MAGGGAGAGAGASIGGWVLPLLLLLLLWRCMAMGEAAGVGAPAPSPSVDCYSAIVALVDCIPFVEEGSKVGRPSKSCCSGLKEVVKKEVACLCFAFKQGSSSGISINTTKALSIPHTCGVSTPPFSKCNIAVSGVPAAAPAPSASPSSSPSVGISGVPAPSPVHSSAAAYPPASLLITVALLAVYSYYL